MSEPLEEEYFNWLCARVVDVQPPTYYGLMTILHRTEFVWVVAEDENRAHDGLNLRIPFCREAGANPGMMWMGCSVLEMLIALAEKVAFQTEISEKDWFWRMLANLGIDEYQIVPVGHEGHIEEILYNFLWRTYSPDGRGGLFPLRKPQHDQRGVEIWYQWAEYVEEQGLY